MGTHSRSVSGGDTSRLSARSVRTLHLNVTLVQEARNARESELLTEHDIKVSSYFCVVKF